MALRRSPYDEGWKRVLWGMGFAIFAILILAPLSIVAIAAGWMTEQSVAVLFVAFFAFMIFRTYLITRVRCLECNAQVADLFGLHRLSNAQKASNLVRSDNIIMITCPHCGNDNTKLPDATAK